MSPGLWRLTDIGALLCILLCGEVVGLKGRKIPLHSDQPFAPHYWSARSKLSFFNPYLVKDLRQ